MARARKRASGGTVGGPSGDSERTAHSHKRTREAHLREKAQDYVEAIADLLSARGEARVVDLARLLGVTHVTVVQSVARLKRAGLVRSEPYRSIFLTPEGEAMAAEAKRRHEVVLAFLLALGVPRAVAESDAEGIEHHVSPATLAGLVRVTAILGRR